MFFMAHRERVLGGCGRPRKIGRARSRGYIANAAFHRVWRAASRMAFPLFRIPLPNQLVFLATKAPWTTPTATVPTFPANPAEARD